METQLCKDRDDRKTHFLSKREDMRAIDFLSTICISVVCVFLILSYTNFRTKDRQLMAENIQVAIEKGINPMTVRCSYAKSEDVICVAFATKMSEMVLESNTPNDSKRKK